MESRHDTTTGSSELAPRGDNRGAEVWKIPALSGQSDGGEGRDRPLVTDKSWRMSRDTLRIDRGWTMEEWG